MQLPGLQGEYRTHQGLGGHVAGHINREKQAAAAARAAAAVASAAAPGRRAITHAKRAGKSSRREWRSAAT